MSDMNNRVNPDYSIYDLMETAALEEILRQDAEAPEGEESDLELILYVMEVLAERRKRNGDFTGKTAEEAYESFIQHYLPEVEELENKKRRPMLRLRRMAAAAAVVAVIFVGSFTAKAFGVDIWNIVATWAEETFHLGDANHVEIGRPDPEDESQYTSLQQALIENNSDPSIVPTDIPDGYDLSTVDVLVNPMQKKFLAIYNNGEKRMKITVQSYLDGYPEQIEQTEGLIEVYQCDGIDYYLFDNYELTKAAWITENYECYIAGEISVEEMKAMIDSIGKD